MRFNVRTPNGTVITVMRVKNSVKKNAAGEKILDKFPCQCYAKSDKNTCQIDGYICQDRRRWNAVV